MNLKRSDWLSKAELTKMSRDTRKGMKAADEHKRKYGTKKSEARSARLIKREINKWGKPEKQIVNHLAWVIQNNPGVETNLLHSHLAFLMANNGGEYSWPTGSEPMSKLPTNKEIIAMLDASGRFMSKNVERGTRNMLKSGGYHYKGHAPRHWWRKDSRGTAIEMMFAA
jgi:hypothetical protein